MPTPTSARPALLLGALAALLALGAAPPSHARSAAQAVAAIRGAPVMVRGTVRGPAGPVAEASVTVIGTTHGTRTDARGRYALAVDASRGDTLRIRVARIGFAPAIAPVAVTADTIVADVVLVSSQLHLDEIVVTGTADASGQAVAESPPPSPPMPSAPTTPGYMAADAARRMHGSMATGAGAAMSGKRASREWNTEEYARVEERGFVAVRSDPLSTFAIDVDRASYGNVRRFLIGEGRMPPADAVRVEELVNYFAYDYAAPTGRHPVGVTTDVAPAPWAPAHRLVRIGLRTRPIDVRDLPPANLVFLVDVSGSMATPAKLPLVKRSLRMLVHELREQDRVSIVVYAGAAGLVLPPTSAANRSDIMDAIENLEAGGSTAGGAGIQLAYDVARRSNRPGVNTRVVLATDGDFNVGTSSTSELVRLVERRREEGTFLTVLGFGMGNLKDGRLEQLADHGNGNYAYIDDLLEARKVLVRELGATLVTVAKDVKLQVEFNPRRVHAYRLLGYENRALADEEFTDDTRDAGEMGAGHTVTALYEIIPVGARSDAEVHEAPPLRYQAGSTTGRAEADELLAVGLRYKRPAESESRLLRHVVRDRVGAPSADFAFASAVAGFGMLLRDSPYRGLLTYAMVRELATPGLRRDADGDRAGFMELVAAAARLHARAADVVER